MIALRSDVTVRAISRLAAWRPSSRHGRTGIADPPALKALLTEEVAGRQASSIKTRRKAAGFPTGKTFDTWDASTSSIPQPTQRSIHHPRVGQPGRTCGPLTVESSESVAGSFHFFDDQVGPSEGPLEAPVVWWLRIPVRQRARARPVSP